MKSKSQWKILKAAVNVDGTHRSAPEELKKPGEGTEIPCVYFFYGAKTQKSVEWEKIKQSKKRFNTEKTRVSILIN